LNDFFRYARERYRIKLRRDAGQPAPWTDDPVLQRFRFCHIFREDDKTTVWFRENVRDPLRDDPVKVALATIGFRWFNRIETGERIKHIMLKHGWDNDAVRKQLKGVYPLITGAYMVRSPYGVNKLDGLLSYMAQLPDVRLLQQPTLQAAHTILREAPGMGDFTAYEVISDLRWTCVLEGASDIMTWASPGPGAARGLEWIYRRPFSRGSQKGVDEQIKLMRRLLAASRKQRYWSKRWPAWDMRTVEHTLCEYDKYRRGQAGGRLKRRYP
jgi:hypothetical protein